MAIDRFDVFRGFEQGQKVGGASPLGSFVKNLTAMAQQVGLSRLKSQEELQSKIAFQPYEEASNIRQAGAKAEAEAQAQLNVLKGFGGQTGQIGGVGGGTVTEATVGPFKVVFPGKSQMEAEEARQKKIAETSGPRKFLREQVVSLHNLVEQVPRPPKGLGRIPAGLENIFKGKVTQEIPQIEVYDRKKKLIAGAIIQAVGGESGGRLSDQDVQRALNANSNISFDTEDVTDMSFAELVDALNDIPEISGTERMNLISLFKGDTDRVIRARRLQGHIDDSKYQRIGVDDVTGDVIGLTRDGRQEVIK